MSYDPSESVSGNPDILVHRSAEDPGVAVVTLNRPDRLNALTPEMGPAYATLLRDLDADPSIRAVVVTGAGRGFCSGADLSTLGGNRADLQSYVRGQSVNTLPVVALTLSTPIATAINGPCAGIGFVLAISADARFVHPEATMSTTFARLGLVAEYGISWILPRLIGLPAATDLLLTGRTITGHEAAELGLATEALDPLDAAVQWATRVARESSPASVAMMKKQLLQSQALTLDETVDSSLDAMSEAFEWPDLQEAMVARAEKRPPEFPNLERS
jgi:enoyl-CoA hydratase/carnithine racemase